MKSHQLAAALGIAIGFATTETSAVPYASGIHNTGGSNYTFVLNEPATNVTVTRDGGNALNLGALGAGRHTFDLGSFTNFDIAVAGSSTAGYNLVDDSGNLFIDFDRPGGLAINNVPSSPYFGTIYVNQNRGLNGGATVTTGAGREMGNGIYSLTADRLGVDLPTWATPGNANDASLAKLPEPFATAFAENDNQGLNSSSAFYRLGMDEAGNLIANDWTNFPGQAGFAYISPDLTTGAYLFSPSADPQQSTIGAGGKIAIDGSGPFYMHGSINGEPQVQGVYGNNLVVRAMDEDLDADNVFTSVGLNDGNAVWEWDFGNATSNATVRPERIIAPGDLYTSSGQDRNTSGVTFPSFSENPAGTHSDGTPVFLDYNIGVTANAQYNAHFDKWYLSGSRSNGDDSSSLVILTPEGPGGDGRDIQVDWASKQFSIDNGLDGYESQDSIVDPDGLSLDPNNDIFRQAHNVTFSPDNTTMYVQRRLVHDTNPVLGTGTDFGTKILAIPLDEEGIPIIGVDDNGTPEDTTDDFVTGITAIDAGVAGSSGSFSQVKTDIAGNLYYTGNQVEALQYFSKGGDTIATTSNNASLTAGAFSLTDGGVGPLPGDANGDGSVDLLDLDILGANFGTMGTGTFATGDFNGDGNVDLLDLDILGGNFGTTAGGAIPEPASVAMLALAAVAAVARRRG